MHTDDPIPERSDSKETVHRRGLPGADTLHKQKNTQKKKEKKTKRKKVEGGKGGDEEQACGRKAVKKQARQTDRWKDEKKKGPYHLASHPAGWTGPLCSFPVQTHLTAVCSLQQQCAHTHACTHTHTAACLTVGTITLLRGIDRGLKVKRMRCWKKIDNSHIQSPGPSSTHKSTQTNRSVVILPAWQPGMNLLSAVLNSSFICPIWSHTPHTHTTKNHTHKQLFGQGRTRSIVTQGKKGGGSGSPNSLSDCSHTPTQKRSVTQACTHTHTFTTLSRQLLCMTPTTHRLTSWCCKARKSRDRSHAGLSSFQQLHPFCWGLWLARLLKHILGCAQSFARWQPGLGSINQMWQKCPPEPLHHTIQVFLMKACKTLSTY